MKSLRVLGKGRGEFKVDRAKKSSRYTVQGLRTTLLPGRKSMMGWEQVTSYVPTGNKSGKTNGQREYVW